LGPERVRDAPAAEAALVGLGIGAAVAGLRPVVELTTATFAALALDQLLHHAAPLRALSGGRLSAPLVVRMPQGGGARLGPIHSQNVEALLQHIPGLVVLAPATPADAHALLTAAIRSEDPTVVLEHAALYDTRGPVDEDGDGASPLVAIGGAAVRRAGADVTLVATSRMALVAEQAAATLAAGHGVAAEVVDLRVLRPLDAATVIASARRTRHVVVVEEGWPDGGIGATLAARVTEATFSTLAAPVARVTGADVLMPYAAPLERAAVPDAEAVVAAVLATRTTTADGPAHTLTTTIDLESLLAERRASATPLADLIAARAAPDLARFPSAAIVLADGTLTLLGAPARHPAATLTFATPTTRPTADAGAVTLRHRTTLTLRLAPGHADAPTASTLLTALRTRLQA
jgi:pyruvate dehydrogenase E1 component beta subunit